MATAELSDNATHEEIQEYVDDVVKNVEADRAGDQSDASKIAADTDDTHAEANAEGDTDTAVKGEKTGKKATSWLDDGLKAEMKAAYGLDETELAEFTSREELDRALRIFDKSALEAGRKALADGDESGQEPTGKTRDERGQFKKKAVEAKEGRYDIALNADEYDEGVVGEFTRMRDHYESRFAAMEERFAEADAAAEERHFDGLVDTLGHSDLLGKTGSENAKQLERRQDLHVAVKAQLLGLEALGRPATLDESLVNRVAHMVFAADLSKKDLKDRTRKLRKQSDGRMGGGATRPTETPESLNEEMRRLYSELENA